MLQKKLQNQFGFTLIELMVASLILGMSITAIMTMLSIGRTIEAGDGLRRQARNIVASTMESAAYQTYAVGANFSNSIVGSLTPSLGPPIPYTLTTNVTSPPAASWTDGNAPPAIIPNSVPYNFVDVQITWVDAGTNESYRLQKWLAK
jgi:prepilin-type N-terminal cleavage/methylation domain-containing protein